MKLTCVIQSLTYNQSPVHQVSTGPQLLRDRDLRQTFFASKISLSRKQTMQKPTAVKRLSSEQSRSGCGGGTAELPFGGRRSAPPMRGAGWGTLRQARKTFLVGRALTDGGGTRRSRPGAAGAPSRGGAAWRPASPSTRPSPSTSSQRNKEKNDPEAPAEAAGRVTKESKSPPFPNSEPLTGGWPPSPPSFLPFSHTSARTATSPSSRSASWASAFRAVSGEALRFPGAHRAGDVEVRPVPGLGKELGVRYFSMWMTFARSTPRWSCSARAYFRPSRS